MILTCNSEKTTLKRDGETGYTPVNHNKNLSIKTISAMFFYSL